ncbi:MAG: nucleotidyl transferase AbiEii/AbiGii toxin family protein [Trueperaceae bacterium]
MLGFSNRWYGAMTAHAVVIDLSEERRVRIVNAPYLIATKLVAFSDRGAGDVLFSRDLGDIVALVDGREEIVDEVLATESTARTFISDAFRALLADPSFVEAIPAHLLPDAASQARAPLIFEPATPRV